MTSTSHVEFIDNSFSYFEDAEAQYVSRIGIHNAFATFNLMLLTRTVISHLNSNIKNLI